MIDIHSHILWGMDDGAKTREQSLKMLQLAALAGTTDIVATPHANFRYPYQGELVKQRIRELTAGSVGLPRIHQGCDFHLNFENIQSALQEPARFAINGGPYLLVEFPDTAVSGMGDALAMLLGHRMVPIMTHPERNIELRRIPDEFQEWIQMGCLVQVTGHSLLGRFGKHAEESSWEMLRMGLVHFIASDAHDETHRPPQLDSAFDRVKKRLGESYARLLFIDNPKAVISNGTITPTLAKRRKWFHFRP